MLKALNNNFVNSVKASSTDPLKIKMHFNPWFMRSDSVYMKVSKVSREVRFDTDGIYFGSEDDKTILIS